MICTVFLHCTVCFKYLRSDATLKEWEANEHSDTLKPWNRMNWKLSVSTKAQTLSKTLSFSKLHQHISKNTIENCISIFDPHLFFSFFRIEWELVSQRTITSKVRWYNFLRLVCVVILMCLSISLNNSLSFQREKRHKQRMRKIKRWEWEINTARTHDKKEWKTNGRKQQQQQQRSS